MLKPVTYLLEYPVFSLLLLAYVIGEFYLQDPIALPQKGRVRQWLPRHLAITSLPLIALGLVFSKIWFALIMVLVSQWFLILIQTWIKTRVHYSTAKLFLFSQILQVVVMVGVVWWQGKVQLPSWLPTQELNLLLFALLITKPVNSSFRLLFRKYQPQDNSKKSKTIEGAGATIGILERLVMGLCLVMGQFAFIGLVFTAKSIARYDKISKNPAFAEYYLIGSLFSILSVLVAAWLCLR